MVWSWKAAVKQWLGDTPPEPELTFAEKYLGFEEPVEIVKPAPVPYDEFFIRHWFPPSAWELCYGNPRGTFHNVRYKTLDEARKYALEGRRKYAMGDNRHCPVAVVRVRWKGALRKAIDEA